MVPPKKDHPTFALQSTHSTPNREDRKDRQTHQIVSYTADGVRNLKQPNQYTHHHYQPIQPIHPSTNSSVRKKKPPATLKELLPQTSVKISRVKGGKEKGRYRHISRKRKKAEKPKSKRTDSNTSNNCRRHPLPPSHLPFSSTQKSDLLVCSSHTHRRKIPTPILPHCIIMPQPPSHPVVSHRLKQTQERSGVTSARYCCLRVF
ncbi:hypothetical protein B0T17DRAFT_263163 [Bombardia bombarda]|uniref:Uncharacterized protein n=1 Tax=Bombardia bombarda TaxID=252184 RepID=A0AA40C4U4_9PEZI|nr:hypothetical protein B0T17DRAFT_263163 [Bombardia bombarda]